MTTAQAIYLLCIPAGILLFIVGIFGFDIIAFARDTPSISWYVSDFGYRNPIIPAVMAALWFGVGAGCGCHWWWPVEKHAGRPSAQGVLERQKVEWGVEKRNQQRRREEAGR